MNYINTRHPNIKFTIETEVNKTIPFLDVLIDNTQNILKTSTYHKSTYSGLPLDYTSFTSRLYEIGLIKRLIDRAYKISNTWSGFHDDVPYIGKYSEQVQKKITKLCKQYCKENNVKIVFTLFKISYYFSVKDATPYFVKSILVYKFVCTRCKSCYIGENCRHFITRIDEHIKKDKSPMFFNIYQ